MTDLHKAAEMALAKLDHLWEIGIDAEYKVELLPEIHTLRQALAQPPCQTGSQCIGGKCPECERQWIGLTDEEISECWSRKITPVHGFAREVEKLLKEKNT